MRKNILKTRRGKLRKNLEEQLVNSDEQQIEMVLSIVDEYEKDNLATIKKLKRNKTVDINRINGALKQTINAHSVITRELIGSASKRIYGSLLNDEKNKPTFFKRVVKWFKNLIK